MTAYLTDPSAIRTAILPGKPFYSFGSQDDHNPGSRMQVTSVAITSNVATLSVQLLAGPIPAVGSLITVRGTQTVTTGGAPNFNVTNVALASVSINLVSGSGTLTFALSSSNVATTTDAGSAVVPPPEVAEALANASGLQCAMLSASGLPNNSRDLMWEVDTPSAPSAFTANLQVAMNDIDGEYETIDTTTATGSRQVLGVRANFARIQYSGVSGGTNPTSIAKILV